MGVPTARQRKILSGMERGDPVFEVAQKPWFTQFDETTDRVRRITLAELTAIETSGWARRVSVGAHRCDHWELTDLGRKVLQASKPGKRHGTGREGRNEGQ